MPAKTLMVQGTGSSVGKSSIVTALCRIFMREGVRVAPFKAQNMSNNAFVTPGNLEIGRSQATQAAAAGIEPSSDMNPILLKPEGDGRSQVVLNGRSVGSHKARSYYEGRDRLWESVTVALDRLRSEHDLVVIEGAGSPAEVNLRDRDIVNMEVALYAKAPVLLVGDIDRGGVFASLLGTLELLRPDERELVKGLIINKFRGDISLLDPLPSMIEKRTGVPVLGVVPMAQDLRIPEEDGMSVERQRSFGDGGPLVIAVVRFPRISNFDDFDPMARAGVSVRYVTRPEEIADAHIVALPGTKHTIADLRWMKSRGIDLAISQALQRGSTVFGVCGGYQMLGENLDDPTGSDGGEPDSETGLGLLPMKTVFDSVKATRRVQFRTLTSASSTGFNAGASGHGYEIHTGRTVAMDKTELQPLVEIVESNGDVRVDGAASGDGLVFGCYVHGMFDSPEILSPLLQTVSRKFGIEPPIVKPFSVDAEFDRLADLVKSSMDMETLHQIVGL